MKLTESWLREWVNPDINRDQLAHLLTMSGLEVEEVLPVSSPEDYVIDISITPNRGDCLSIKGIAREVSALTKTPLNAIKIQEIKPSTKETRPVKIESAEGCPRYIGRVIQHVKADAATPVWLQNRLQHAGIRSINAVVDVTNYVMLELGQPMHAFDLDKIEKGIIVRQSKQGEKISLLDGTEKTLDDKTVVIADNVKPLAIAGVMGGMDSGVTSLTKDVFLESAFFTAKTIARQRQYYNLNSDSAYRFERGIDSTLQREAIERATQLILDIAGGEAGPVIEEKNNALLPQPAKVTLLKTKLAKLLGIHIADQQVEEALKRLQFKTELLKSDHWEIQVPAYRPDITLPEDIIEEIARIHGYDNIPTHKITAALEANVSNENNLAWLRQALSNLGCHEVINYSFIDKKMQAMFDPDSPSKELVNPITADMEVMRTSLWPGLVNSLLFNKSRQLDRVRLFEIGCCFLPQGKQIEQKTMLAGLITGLNSEEQWGIGSRQIDFFDLKGILENVLKIASADNNPIFKPDNHPALHPGQTAAIYLNDEKIGVIGALNPKILEALDLPRDPQNRVYVFELDLANLQKRGQTQLKPISKFPEIRRDIAILLKQTVPAQVIQDTICNVAGDWLKDVFIFDVYQGKGISPGLKSVAVGLVFQHPSRTLVDDEVTTSVEQVIKELKERLGAELRS